MIPQIKLRVKHGVCSKVNVNLTVKNIKVNVNLSLNLKILKRFSAKIKREKEFHTA